MKLCTFRSDDAAHAGVVTDEGFVGLAAAAPELPKEIAGRLATGPGALAPAKRAGEEARSRLPLDALRLERVLARAAAAALPGTDPILISASQPASDVPLVIGWQNVTLRGVSSCTNDTPAVRGRSFRPSDGVIVLGDGGGIYATDGASVTLLGDADAPATIAENRAFTSGGGLALDVAGTTGRAANARGGDGAGIAVLFATAAIRQTYLTGNRAATLENGDVAFVYGSDSVLRIEGSMLHANSGGGEVLAVEAGADLVLAFTPTASNLGFGVVFFTVGLGAIAKVYSSVFGEADGDLVEGWIPGSPGGCVIRSRADAVRGDWGMFQVVATPESLFRSVAAGDLHLRAGAAPIDFCDTVLYTPEDLDFGDDPRGMDQAGVPNGRGPYDAGDDEVVPEPRAALATVARVSRSPLRRSGRMRPPRSRYAARMATGGHIAGPIHGFARAASDPRLWPEVLARAAPIHGLRALAVHFDARVARREPRMAAVRGLEREFLESYGARFR